MHENSLSRARPRVCLSVLLPPRVVVFLLLNVTFGGGAIHISGLLCFMIDKNTNQPPGQMVDNIASVFVPL